MLAVRTGFSDYKLSEVPLYIRERASEREGEWTIIIHEARSCCIAAAFKKCHSYHINLTENEYSKLSRTLYHGIRNQTKATSLFANMENTAQALWPTGSLDDVTMRHLGVIAVSQYVTRESTAYGWRGPLHCLAKCLQWDRLPELRRNEKPEEEPPEVLDWDASPVGDGGSSPTGSSDAPDHMAQPSTPGDPDVAANAAENGRTAEINGVVAVVGQNFDKDEPVDHMPIMGALIGPCQVKPNVYSKTASNLKAAINERIIKKARKPSLSKADRARIGKLIKTAMSKDERRGLFSKARIQQWAIDCFDMEKCKSKKWGRARFANALANLYAKENPESIFKAGIKPENMPEGKSPRMLIADGDEGQLMALAVVKCFEDLLFHHFEQRSIKHCSKQAALSRVVETLKKKGACAIEGDGSAWDTTCNVLIRQLVENPILRHIMKELAEFGVIPESWMEEHQRACEQKTLKLFFSNKFEKMSTTIDAIRRSGHRGTSCLNWWINFTMWTTSVFAEPQRFLDPTIRKGIDLTGHMRWWNGCFEGDDSLCTMDPPMRPDDALSKIFMKYWSDAGFNMKIVYCDTRATFVGWHIGCDKGEINDFRSPELPRALANSGVSVSPSTVQAAKNGDIKMISSLAAASALARAADFSGILPTVSRKYYNFAEACEQANFDDREMSYRAFGEEGHDANTVREMILERNAEVSHIDEQETMDKLGYSATLDELMTFTEYIWDLEPANLVAYEAFKESLPASWRVVA